MHVHIDFNLPETARLLLETELTGHRLTYAKHAAESVLSAAPPDEMILKADVVFGQPDPAYMLKSASLKFAHISTSGITRYDTVDFKEKARRKGLLVCNSAHVYNDACAEHVFSFLLAQSRLLPEALSTRDTGGAGNWVAFRNRCVSLKGQRMVIVGYGAIAERLVQLAAPFQMKITAYRRVVRGNESIPVITTEQDLSVALRQADHVVNILPQHPETKEFFEQNRFRQFKEGSVFYNIGRGSTVNQKDLLHALDEHKPAAAWLDVTEPEPLPENHPLWLDSRVRITPHVAGGHHGESIHLVQHFLRNFRAFLSKEKLADSIL